MNPLEFVGKLLWTAWPFVKEMVLEGRSLKHAFLFNRRRAIFSVIIMLSFFFNVVNMSADARMVAILSKYVKLKKEHDALLVSDKQLKQQLEGVCPAQDASSATPASAPVAASEGDGSADSEYQLLKSTFAHAAVTH